ncbi:hypothetical protein F3I27_23400 [Pantoea sp. Bo_2]|uniref:Phage protein n=1 Tax=Candidatus Pantoea gossypiicola TaxID=2608008 RepID=A0AB34CGV9_9GAMM|nr:MULTISPECIES: hypothetical protein [Pantoea]KAA5920543.1 hypothetical protein F3I59_23770 [Pantoea sp. VH_8]KAA5927128.1 hypothetical protein F3I58_23825 [Pantoea sp. VH_4]KAA5935932.1 hypothetical protein F3I57_23025 [Pantoea sp. VH_3]KAA5944893.1 hypothetical protein F3I56_23040 [Pantoea sp. VH_25]KAA5949400.1 hypothetical protein F3I55_22695 [Pantoea sp. VH_24]
MLKFKLTSDEYDALDESQKSFYAEAEGGYQLKIEGVPDVSGLEKKVTELLNEKKIEQERRREAELQAQREREDAARKKGDIETLEKSWQEKLTTREQELQATIDAHASRLHTLLVDNVAQSLATKLAGDSAAILIPHIRARLTVEDGKTRVVDAEGRPSAATLDELEKEFKENKLFAPVVIVSRATGTRGAGNLPSGSAEGKKWDDFTEAERVKLFNDDPEAFKRLAATQNK